LSRLATRLQELAYLAFLRAHGSKQGFLVSRNLRSLRGPTPLALEGQWTGCVNVNAVSNRVRLGNPQPGRVHLCRLDCLHNGRSALGLRATHTFGDSLWVVEAGLVAGAPPRPALRRSAAAGQASPVLRSGHRRSADRRACLGVCPGALLGDWPEPHRRRVPRRLRGGARRLERRAGRLGGRSGRRLGRPMGDAQCLPTYQ